MNRIKAIPYERIEEKNELEQKLFSKLTYSERFRMKELWFRLLDSISKSIHTAGKG
jgi:hypothetical protein